MKKLLKIAYFLALLGVGWGTAAEAGPQPRWRSGDLVFIHADCGSLCAAIADVTLRQFQVQGPALSHMGILSQEHGQWVVYEAWDEVRRTKLDEFLRRGVASAPWYWGRVHASKRQRLTAVAAARQRLGLPYDPDFVRDNGKYYCSELVADAYLDPATGRATFSYSPMYFGEAVATDPSYPIWESYFRARELPIPAGKPGVSPLGIYLSESVTAYPSPPGAGDGVPDTSS